MTSTITSEATPITFRLPKPGESDKHFGFSRSFYYVGEQRGYWKLIRITDEGCSRGVTLVPFSAVATYVKKQMEAAQ
jgi:hypothetical protein